MIYNQYKNNTLFILQLTLCFFGALLFHNEYSYAKNTTTLNKNIIDDNITIMAHDLILHPLKL